MTAKKEDVLKQLEELREHEDDKYTELTSVMLVAVKHVTDDAALLDVRFHRNNLPKRDEVWFPFSQMRQLDGLLFVSNWILEKKEITL